MVGLGSREDDIYILIAFRLLRKKIVAVAKMTFEIEFTDYKSFPCITKLKCQHYKTAEDIHMVWVFLYIIQQE
jgi:hypothetical protein